MIICFGQCGSGLFSIDLCLITKLPRQNGRNTCKASVQCLKNRLWFAGNCLVEIIIIRSKGVQLILCLSNEIGLAGKNLADTADCRTIFQDSRGYMWFGTYMGLNRYDGHRFAVYDRDDLCGISDFIHAIEEDDNGDLWIGTDDGLVVYDYDLDTFRCFDMESDAGTVVRNKVNCIRKDASGVIWFAANGQGLFSYDVKTGQFRNSC